MVKIVMAGATSAAPSMLDTTLLTTVDHIFQSLDRDNDQVLTNKDFALITTGPAVSPRRACKFGDLWHLLKTHCDTNGDGTISQAEFHVGILMLALKRPSPPVDSRPLGEQLAVLKQRLNTALAHAAGGLYDHFNSACTGKQCAGSGAAAAAAYPELRLGERISAADARTMVSIALQKGADDASMISYMLRDRLQKIFTLLDANKDKKVSLEDFSILCSGPARMATCSYSSTGTYPYIFLIVSHKFPFACTVFQLSTGRPRARPAPHRSRRSGHGWWPSATCRPLTVKSRGKNSSAALSARRSRSMGRRSRPQASENR